MQLTYKSTHRRIQNNSPSSQANSVLAADGTALSIIEWSQCEHLNLDAEQQVAFQIVTAAYILTYYDDAEGLAYRSSCSNPSQVRRDFKQEKQKLRDLARLKIGASLFMFLDGAGGSGKSRVVQEVLKYAKEFTTNLNLTFDMRTIIVCALSGVAAVSIGGETLASVAAFNREIANDDNTWANARLLIIDEVSFMSTLEVEKLDVNLRTLCRRYNALFGGLHILFCGDFCQLEPVSGRPLYSVFHSDRKWANAINCYVELLGLHRFKDDPEWGRILARIRNDTHTQHDIDAINECLVGPNRPIPNNPSYCVYGNADRTAINTGVFHEVLRHHWQSNSDLPTHIVAIKAGSMERLSKGGKKLSMGTQDRQYIYENCGDHCVRAKVYGRKGHFVDPMLKLYHGIPLMLVSNDDVPNGHANGTRVLLESVVVKTGANREVIEFDGMKCPAINGDDVCHLVCGLEGDPSKKFIIKPKTITCSVQAPLPKSIGGNLASAKITFSVSLCQLPVLVNNATTGHKLQGQTKINLVISVWSRKRNWNYVALSRVQTRKGLFTISKLPYDVDFSKSHELSDMMLVMQHKRPSALEWDLEEERELLAMRRRTAGYH
jgi:hypothetical protein